MHSLKQEIWENVCKYAVRKSQTNSTNMVLIHLCYEYEFAKAQCGKYKQMQQMWLCILSGGQFEDITKNFQCRKEKRRSQ